MRQTSTALDLFSGCGGFSVGLLAAGYRVLAGFDSYPRCIWTYDHNHRTYGTKGVLADLSHSDRRSSRVGGRKAPPALSTGEALLSVVGAPPIDLVCGGPPCQAFSIRGKRRGLEDVRGTLVFDFARLVDEIRPKAFIFENVANLASLPMRPVLEELLSKFAASGYKTSWTVLLAADYGVAQNRRRLFIIGSRSRRLDFPRPTYSGVPIPGRYRHLTAADVLSDIPDVGTPAAAAFENHEPTHHTPEMLRAFRRLLPGRRDPKSHHDRLHPSRPGYTLRAGVGNFSPLRPIHYEYHRVVSVRESARLQGFPDDFVWPPNVPRLQQYRQVGNSVPPPLAEAVASYVGQQLGLPLAPVQMAFPGADRSVLWDDDDLPGKQRVLQLPLMGVE